VAGVTVGVCGNAALFPGVDNKGPFLGTISAMMSHQFAVAAAVVTGSGGIDAVRRYADPAINDFAGRVTVEVDEDLERRGVMGARVRVELTSGEILENLQESVEPQTEEGVVARTYEYGKAYFSEDILDGLIDAYRNMDEIDDVHAIMRLVKGRLS
jgi:2-methylcitrate dehydratase PrpD